MQREKYPANGKKMRFVFANPFFCTTFAAETMLEWWNR